MPLLVNEYPQRVTIQVNFRYRLKSPRGEVRGASKKREMRRRKSS